MKKEALVEHNSGVVLMIG